MDKIKNEDVTKWLRQIDELRKKITTGDEKYPYSDEQNAINICLVRNNGNIFGCVVFSLDSPSNYDIMPYNIIFNVRIPKLMVQCIGGNKIMREYAKSNSITDFLNNVMDLVMEDGFCKKNLGYRNKFTNDIYNITSDYWDTLAKIENLTGPIDIPFIWIPLQMTFIKGITTAEEYCKKSKQGGKK